MPFSRFTAKQGAGVLAGIGLHIALEQRDHRVSRRNCGDLFKTEDFKAPIALVSPHSRWLQCPASHCSRALSGIQDALSERLRILNTINTLKAQAAANPGDVAVQRQLRRAAREYAAISAQLGGDKALEPDATPYGPPAGEAVPAPPPNCPAPTVTTGTNTTPVAIPDSPASRPHLDHHDRRFRRLALGRGPDEFITHTFASGLDITLTSPAGTS